MLNVRFGEVLSVWENGCGILAADVVCVMRFLSICEWRATKNGTQRCVVTGGDGMEEDGRERCVLLPGGEVFVGHDAIDDGAGAAVLVPGALAAFAFGGVREVTTFDEHGGTARFVEHGEGFALACVAVADF